MTNAETFYQQFGIYATELWSMPETEFLHWLNTEFAANWIHIHGVVTPGGDPYYECSFCHYGRCYGVEHPKPLPDVCPRCGAAMGKKEERWTI